MSIENIPGAGLSTEALARAAGVKDQTLRAAYCRDGHWCGLVPRKLRNRRLLWPMDSLERLTERSEGVSA